MLKRQYLKTFFNFNVCTNIETQNIVSLHEESI
jgi:hypothetical protein